MSWACNLLISVSDLALRTTGPTDASRDAHRNCLEQEPSLPLSLRDTCTVGSGYSFAHLKVLCLSSKIAGVTAKAVPSGSREFSRKNSELDSVFSSVKWVLG